LIPSRVAALLMLAAMAGAFVPAVAAQGDQTNARIFIQTAERAKEIALEFIERARSSGTDVSAALGLVEEGGRLLAQAKAAYDRGDYDSAAADARLAQTRFRDALKMLGPEKATIEQEAEARLREAIERARERIQKVREALASSTEITDELEQIRRKLYEAEGLLKEAESILGADVENSSEAARKTAQAEKLVSEAFVMLKQASGAPNRHRIEAFLKNMEKEIQKLRNDLEQMARRGIRIDDLRSLLDTAEGLLKTAQGKASDGDLNGALSDIEQVRNIIEQVRREVSGRQRHGP